MRRTTPVEPLEPIEPIEPAPLFRKQSKSNTPPYPLSHLCYNRENYALHERNPR